MKLFKKAFRETLNWNVRLYSVIGRVFLQILSVTMALFVAIAGFELVYTAIAQRNAVIYALITFAVAFKLARAWFKWRNN